jgi:ribonuclease P protein component
LRGGIHFISIEQKFRRKNMKTLKKRSEFLTVAKGGRIARRAFVLQAAKTRSDGDPRMGYTVTKKTGNSVERSRIKRRLRAAVASLDLDIAQIGADYVLVGRRAALSQPFEDLLKDLKGSVKNAFKPRKPRPIRSKPNSLANSKPPHDKVEAN